MNIITRLKKKLAQDEGGSLSSAMVPLTITLIVVAGLVYDGAGQIQARESAHQIAASASRTAANSLSGETLQSGSLSLSRPQAISTAQDYISASGLTGTVNVTGGVVTVTVKNPYKTKLLSLIGINSLYAESTSAARLITQ